MPSIPDIISNVLMGGSLKAAHNNLTNWTGPEGVSNFNKDVTSAMNDPQNMAFMALNPMVGMPKLTADAAKMALAKARGVKADELIYKGIWDGFEDFPGWYMFNYKLPGGALTTWLWPLGKK